MFSEKWEETLKKSRELGHRGVQQEPGRGAWVCDGHLIAWNVGARGLVPRLKGVFGIEVPVHAWEVCVRGEACGVHDWQD